MKNEGSKYFLNKQMIKRVEWESLFKKDLEYIKIISLDNYKIEIKSFLKYYKNKLFYIIN